MVISINRKMHFVRGQDKLKRNEFTWYTTWAQPEDTEESIEGAGLDRVFVC